jgi:hypothetical protein
LGSRGEPFDEPRLALPGRKQNELDHR